MAFKGSLEDLPAVDLIQLLHQAHKTGVLALKADEEEAAIQYREGNIVGARLRDHVGLEVIVQISDWSKGEFEFQLGPDDGTDTIGMEFHRVLMSALKIKDERKMEEERRKAQETLKASQPQSEACSRKLQELIKGTDSILHACLLDGEGHLLGEARNAKAAQEDLNGLRSCLNDFNKVYPRPGVRRLLIEDDAGTVAMASTGPQSLFLVVTERGTPLGSVAMTVNRLAARLEEKGSAE